MPSVLSVVAQCSMGLSNFRLWSLGARGALCHAHCTSAYILDGPTHIEGLVRSTCSGSIQAKADRAAAYGLVQGSTSAFTSALSFPDSCCISCLNLEPLTFLLGCSKMHSCPSSPHKILAAAGSTLWPCLFTDKQRPPTAVLSIPFAPSPLLCGRPRALKRSTRSCPLRVLSLSTSSASLGKRFFSFALSPCKPSNKYCSPSPSRLYWHSHS